MVGESIVTGTRGLIPLYDIDAAVVKVVEMARGAVLRDTLVVIGINDLPLHGPVLLEYRLPPLLVRTVGERHAVGSFRQRRYLSECRIGRLLVLGGYAALRVVYGGDGMGLRSAIVEFAKPRLTGYVAVVGVFHLLRHAVSLPYPY